MKIPGFSAESSLYESKNRYGNRGTHQGSNQTTVIPSAMKARPVSLRSGARQFGRLSSEDDDSTVWADENCWYIEEGGAMCQGCCYPVNGSWHCWEECTDVMTSKDDLLAR